MNVRFIAYIKFELIKFELTLVKYIKLIHYEYNLLYGLNMEIRESCSYFFEDTIGYIGCSEHMPPRSCTERICGIFALVILSTASAGTFLVYETYRFCAIHWDVLALKNCCNTITNLIPFIQNKYVLAPTRLVTTLSNNIHKMSPGDCMERLKDCIQDLNGTIKIIVPRMDFFATFSIKNDQSWLVFFIIFFGTGASVRGSSTDKANFATNQLLAYLQFMCTLSENDLNTLISAIAAALKNQQSFVNVAIENSWINFAETLSFASSDKRDESFKKIVTLLLSQVPNQFQDHYKKLIKVEFKPDLRPKPLINLSSCPISDEGKGSSFAKELSGAN